MQAIWKDTCSPCSKHAHGHQIQRESGNGFEELERKIHPSHD